MKVPNYHKDLRPVLLQVLTKDIHGPVTLRVRADDETVDLSNEDEGKREFYVMYALKDHQFGLTTWSTILNEVAKLSALSEERDRAKTDLEAQIAGIRRDVEANITDRERLTKELRELKREHDPERVNALVKQAVNVATGALEETLKVERAKVARLESEVTELRASKKKLKEANERLKEGWR